MSNDSFLNADAARMSEIYGPQWRQLPCVYGSLGLGGDDWAERTETHEKICQFLAPNVMFLSPLRHVASRPVQREWPFAEVDAGQTTPEMAFVRDMHDLSRSKAILLDASPSCRKVPVWRRKATGQVILREPDGNEAVMGQALSEWEHVGHSVIETPWTGTVIEVFQSAYHHRIPVLAYNWSERCGQANNPVFFKRFVTAAFTSWRYACDYLLKNWLA